MSITAVSEATPARSISWFRGAEGEHVYAALDRAPALFEGTGEPVAPPFPVAQLLEDAAINAAGEPWKAESLLAHLNPAVLADMLHDPVPGPEVTRQVPLSAGVSVEVTVRRMVETGGPLFWQLWIASF
jgi:hypothetical protein